MIDFVSIALGEGDVRAQLSVQDASIIAAPLRTNSLRFTGDPCGPLRLRMDESAEPFCISMPCTLRASEREVNSNLKLSRVAVRAADLTEIRIRQVRVRIRIVWRVGQVECIELHGYLHRLMNGLRLG